MKAYAGRECCTLFAVKQRTCISTSKILKKYHIHIVLIQFYVEPGTDFNVLFFKSFLALSGVVLKFSLILGCLVLGCV